MKKLVRHHWLTIIVIFLVLAVTLVTGLFFWFRHPNVATLPPQNAPLRLSMDIWPGNFWVLVADANGYFKEEGLAVEIVDISDTYFDSLESVAQGKLLTGCFTIFDFIKKNIEGADLVAVWQSDLSKGGEGILAKSGTDNISQLRGKKIGVEKGTYLDYFLDTALLANGISEKDFIKVDIKTDDLSNAFASGDVDAIVYWEPDLSQIAQEYGGNKISDTSKIKGFSANVLPFRRAFLNNNPEDVRRLIRVLEKATNYIKAHPSETMDLVSRYPFKVNSGKVYTVDEIQKLMDKDHILDLDENKRAFSFSAGFESLFSNLQYAYRYFQRAGILTSELDVDKMIDANFIYGSY